MKDSIVELKPLPLCLADQLNLFGFENNYKLA